MDDDWRRIFLRPAARSPAAPAAENCVSCGRDMDFSVFYTICPHCGFNYSIRTVRAEDDDNVQARALIAALAKALCVVLAMYVVMLFLMA